MLRGMLSSLRHSQEQRLCYLRTKKIGVHYKYPNHFLVMNTNLFSPKVTQPLLLRVSERRQHTTQHIDRSCFKKRYKPKAAKLQTVVNDDIDKLNCLENQQRSHRMILELAAHKLFRKLPLISKQAKTVQSLRVKRLKKLLNHQAVVDIVLSETSLQSRNLLLTLKNSKKKAIVCRKVAFRSV